MLNFIVECLLYLFAFGTICLLGVGCMASAHEVDQRRKNWKAGTHDYYGNKLDG